MIPETRDNGDDRDVSGKRFPVFVGPRRGLMSDVAAADSTLLHYHDKWWLFTAGVLDHASPDENFVPVLRRLPVGPWTAHPKRIPSFPTSARPSRRLLVFRQWTVDQAGSGLFKWLWLRCPVAPGRCALGNGLIRRPSSRALLLTGFAEAGAYTLSIRMHQFRVIDCKILDFRVSTSTYFPAFRRSTGSYGNSFAFESRKEF